MSLMSPLSPGENFSGVGKEKHPKQSFQEISTNRQMEVIDLAWFAEQVLKFESCLGEVRDPEHFKILR